jgi:hypothetical protein
MTVPEDSLAHIDRIQPQNTSPPAGYKSRRNHGKKMLLLVVAVVQRGGTRAAASHTAQEHARNRRHGFLGTIGSGDVTAKEEPVIT